MVPVQGREYWMSQSTAGGARPATIMLEAGYLADNTSAGILKPGCAYSLKYYVSATDVTSSARKADATLAVRMIDTDGRVMMGSFAQYTTEQRPLSRFTTSVPFGVAVESREFTFTAKAGVYRFIATIEVPAAGTGRPPAAARGIGITSPDFALR